MSATDINNLGQVVGYVLDESTLASTGFLYDNWSFTELHVPGGI